MTKFISPLESLEKQKVELRENENLAINRRRDKREEFYYRWSFILSIVSLCIATAAFCFSAFNFASPYVHSVRIVDAVSGASRHL